jgi:hypothetical protein
MKIRGLSLGVAGFLFWVCTAAFAQKREISFGDYAVPVHFAGAVAKAQRNTPNSRTYKTMIRYAMERGPNFADHYVLASWGCGMDCVMFSIIDARDGRVYDAPFIVTWTHEIDPGVHMIRDSRAIHIVGSRNEAEESVDCWYVWDGTRLKLIATKGARVYPDTDSSSN